MASTSTSLLPLLDQPLDTTTPDAPYFVGKWYWYALTLLVVLNVADNVLVVVLFDTFGERYAQFINQGTAFVYILWSSLILLYRRCRSPSNTTELPTFTSTSTLTTDKNLCPYWVLIGIGMMNGTANFCMAIAQPHTPGLTQTLLNLLGIPLVLFMSAIFLNKKSTTIEWLGALLIVVGTCVSGMRTLLQSSDSISDSSITSDVAASLSPSSSSSSSSSSVPSTNPIVAYIGSVVLYACAQLFLSGEKIWEEKSFTRYTMLDPMVMFWYTLITQFSLGWLLYPIQTLPSFGNLSLASIPSVIGGGVLCTFGDSSGGTTCDASNTIIFFVYCSVDFWCYFFGLWIIQRGGANLMVITTAISLPLQQLVLCMRPLLGKWAEKFFWGDSAALALVLAGFLVYQRAHATESERMEERQGGGGGEGRDNNYPVPGRAGLSGRKRRARAKIQEANGVAEEKAAARRMSSKTIV